jgi:hypothetical protein
MARISGSSAKQGGPFRRIFVGLVYALTKRRLGRVIMPIQVGTSRQNPVGLHPDGTNPDVEPSRRPEAQGPRRTPRRDPGRLSVLNRHRLCREQSTRHHCRADREPEQLL